MMSLEILSVMMIGVYAMVIPFFIFFVLYCIKDMKLHNDGLTVDKTTFESVKILKEMIDNLNDKMNINRENIDTMKDFVAKMAKDVAENETDISEINDSIEVAEIKFGEMANDIKDIKDKIAQLPCADEETDANMDNTIKGDVE